MRTGADSRPITPTVGLGFDCVSLSGERGSSCCGLFSVRLWPCLSRGYDVDGERGDERHQGHQGGDQGDITKVDAKAGTITVKMKDKDSKDGKEVEKTFKLTEEVRYFDSTGKAIAIDEFQSGNDVLVLEVDGKLKEVRKDKKPTGPDKKPTEPDKK